jgi:Fur family ferric uptake transcriptional regulator
MSAAAERQHFLDYLRSHGHRVTRERLAVFDEIYARHEHVDAERLLAALRERGAKTSRATVYRNLELLVECGLVRRSRLGEGRVVYEHVHAGQEHDHLVCARCGRVVEFVSPGIAALQAEICRAHGFVPGRHTLQIHGICNACAAAGPEGGGAGNAAGRR